MINKKMNGLSKKEGILTDFDFRFYNMDGTCSLNQITNGEYEYYALVRVSSEDPGIEYYFSRIVTDKPISDVYELVQGIKKHGYYTFNDAILNHFIENGNQRLIDKGLEFDAEVYAKEYEGDQSYRPNAPWSKIQTIIEEYKKQRTV